MNEGARIETINDAALHLVAGVMFLWHGARQLARSLLVLRMLSSSSRSALRVGRDVSA